MAAKKKELTFFDLLRARAGRGGSGGGGGTVIKRTVYGTQDDEAYMCKDGALYRVRKGKNNGGN